MATRQELDESTSELTQPSNGWKPYSNSEPSATETESQSVKEEKNLSSNESLTRLDDSEEMVDVTPSDDMPYDNEPGGDYYYQRQYPQSCNVYTPWYPSLHNRLWVRGEYLLWWTKGSHLPPLVTTSTADTQINEAGVLGQSGTSILFGNGTVNTGANSGGRILLGYWFNDCKSTGIEFGYLGIGRETASFSATNSETPILARPYYDTQLSSQSAMLTAYPNYMDGSISCKLTSEFQALELLLRHNMFRGSYNRMDFLIGWRYARLDECLQINQYSEWPEAVGPIAAETTKSLYDLFDTQNQFNGVELGIMYRAYAGRWSLEAAMKLGLGCTHSRVLINGLTTTTVPNVGTSTYTGDLLAQETNMGQYSHDRFAVVPELGLTLSYALTNRLHATFGYTFLYWSQVARPSEQLDTNLSQLPPETPTGSLQPAFNFIMSDYWAQGMNFGLEYCF